MKPIGKIWERPWGYTEGFIVAGGIALAGILLQLQFGNLGPSDYSFPVNLIVGILFVAGLLCCHFLLRANHVIRWLSGTTSTVPALLMLLTFVVVMGLTPQYSGELPREELPDTLFSRIGWYRMTTSWAFVLLCFYILTILGLTLLKKSREVQSWRLAGFYLNHLGLFLALLAGLLGSGDIRRFTVQVNEGEVEWRDLPLAIELERFEIEEYPPRLVVIDNRTGKILPVDRPESYMFEATGRWTELNGNRIEIVEYLPQAVPVDDPASVTFVPMQMDGAATALKVRVINPSLGKPVEGWVSNGSYRFPYRTLPIDEATSLAMPMQEVKRYTSWVTVYTEAGEQKKGGIEVNRPLSIGGWTIYQYGYDESMGKYSKQSVFELVRDPWLPLVYTGIFMLLAGALFLFVAGPKKPIIES